MNHVFHFLDGMELGWHFSENCKLCFWKTNFYRFSRTKNV